MRIGICVGGCNAEDELKTSKMVHLFFAEALNPKPHERRQVK